MNIKERLATIEEGLLETINEQEKLQLFIALGEELQQDERKIFTEKDKVPGCASDVFVQVFLEEGKIHFKTFSASLIIKGYVAILLKALQDQEPETIINSEKDIKIFLESTKLELISVVPSRTNSFSRLYEYMKTKTRKLTKK